jgi:hypothetical protein
MKTAAYLLIVLTLFTCVDDALLAIGQVRPAQAFTDVDDVDLVVTKRDEDDDQSAPRDERLALFSVTPKTCEALSALAVGVVPSGSNLTGPLAPPSLYVLMSFQC